MKMDTARQQATANNLSFLSLVFPRTNCNIAAGSVQFNHSASVTVFSPLVPSVVQLAA
jgi:hypothetical protein